MFPRTWPGLILIALLIVELDSCSNGHSGDASNHEATFKAHKDTGVIDISRTAVPSRFRTVAVEAGPELRRPQLTARIGTVESRTSPSFSPLDGRIERVVVHLSQRVKRGDRLALLRSPDLATLQRELRTSKLSAQTKTRLKESLELLSRSRAVAERELLQAKSELDDARLSTSAAAARLRALGIEVASDDRFWLVASQDGTVVQLNGSPGLRVGPTSDKPVATIADLDEVMIFGDVLQKDSVNLTVGQSADILLHDAQLDPVQGIVESVSDVLDAERQTVPVRIRVKNATRLLRPNAYAQVSFPPREGKTVLSIPTTAVVHVGLETAVFVEIKPGVFKLRRVTVGRETDQRATIEQGLEAGERVVSRDAILLAHALFN